MGSSPHVVLRSGRRTARCLDAELLGVAGRPSPANVLSRNLVILSERAGAHATKRESKDLLLSRMCRAFGAWEESNGETTPTQAKAGLNGPPARVTCWASASKMQSGPSCHRIFEDIALNSRHLG